MGDCQLMTSTTNRTLKPQKPAWMIEEDEYIIQGSTGMDNFDMGEFLDRIGVNSDLIKWDY